jgi:hypothetical protein
VVTGFAPVFERNDEGDFVLRPPECPSREELERELADPIELPDPLPSRPPPPQFSLRDVMFLMVGVAGGLAGGTWMPSEVFAAILGLAMLLGLLVVTWHPPETHLGKIIWASLVVAYFSAVLAAIVRPPTEVLP